MVRGDPSHPELSSKMSPKAVKEMQRRVDEAAKPYVVAILAQMLSDAIEGKRYERR